jgi:hypothetical protein
MDSHPAPIKTLLLPRIGVIWETWETSFQLYASGKNRRERRTCAQASQVSHLPAALAAARAPAGAKWEPVGDLGAAFKYAGGGSRIFVSSSPWLAGLFVVSASHCRQRRARCPSATPCSRVCGRLGGGFRASGRGCGFSSEVAALGVSSLTWRAGYMANSTAASGSPSTAFASPRRRRAAVPPTVHRDSAVAPEVDERPSSASTAGAPAPVVGDGFTFRGVPLEKLTPSRQALWTSHRLAVGAPPLELCVKDTNAFLADALRIIWICSHDSSVWSVLRGNPAAMEQAISSWADEVPGENAAEVVLLGLRVYAAACAASGF